MDNRMNILEKALHLFYEKGYDAIGVQEIADAAGVTKPTLYHGRICGSADGNGRSHPISGGSSIKP